MQRREILQLAGAAVSGAVAAGTVPLAQAEPAAPHSQRSRVSTRSGVELRYSDWGEGKPVVFVHSWAMASEMWDYQVADFRAAGRRCVTYDRRGHGRSDVPGAGYDFDTLADDLAALLEALDLHDVTLVSHSMGAAEITRYMTRHQGARVERIVFLAPTTPCLLHSPSNPAGIPRAVFEQTWALWEQDFPHWLEQNTDGFITPETSREMRRWLADMLLRTPLQVLIACHQSVVDADFRAELAKFNRPLLILQGDHDLSAPLALTGQATAAIAPGAKFGLIRGAPHGLFITHRDQVNSRMLSFLRS